MNVWALSATYHKTSGSTSSTNVSTGAKVSDIALEDSATSLSLMYGFADGYAFSISSGSGTIERTINPVSNQSYILKETGLKDIAADFMGIVPMNGWNLHFSLGALTGLHSAHKAVQGKDGTLITGGNQYSGMLGFSSISGSATYGSSLRYISKSERAVGNNQLPEAEDKINGGNSWIAGFFYEYLWDGALLDASLSYTRVQDETTTFADQTTSRQTEYSVIAPQVGAQYQLHSWINLRVDYTISMTPEITSGAFKTGSFNANRARIRARFEF